MRRPFRKAVLIALAALAVGAGIALLPRESQAFVDEYQEQWLTTTKSTEQAAFCGCEGATKTCKEWCQVIGSHVLGMGELGCFEGGTLLYTC